MVKDMTSGSPTRMLIAFAIPLVIGNVFQVLYNMVDTIVVGQFIGSDALAAVGATGSAANLLLGLVTGMTNSFSVKISQFFGAKDTPRMQNAIATSICISVIGSLLLTVLGFFSAPTLLQWMRTPEGIFADSLLYLRIIYLGIGATFFYNLLAAMIRALGDSRTPLYFLIIASLLNVVLDLLFIVVIPMGVAGVAVATVLSQLLSGLLCLVHIHRKLPMLRIGRGSLRPDSVILHDILKLGLGSGFRGMIVSVGGMFAQSVINRFGEDVIAANTVASKAEQLVIFVIVSLGSAMSAFVGQNYGAKKWKRLRDGTVSCMLLSMICSTVLGLLTFFFADQIVYLFVGDANPMILYYARFTINRIMPFLYILCSVNVLCGLLQGMGYAGIPFISGMLEIGARLGVSFAMAGIAGYPGVVYANPAAWCVSSVLLVPYSIHVMKKLRKSMPEESAVIQG